MRKTPRVKTFELKEFKPVARPDGAATADCAASFKTENPADATDATAIDIADVILDSALVTTSAHGSMPVVLFSKADAIAIADSAPVTTSAHGSMQVVLFSEADATDAIADSAPATKTAADGAATEDTAPVTTSAAFDATADSVESKVVEFQKCSLGAKTADSDPTTKTADVDAATEHTDLVTTSAASFKTAAPNDPLAKLLPMLAFISTGSWRSRSLREPGPSLSREFKAVDFFEKALSPPEEAQPALENFLLALARQESILAPLFQGQLKCLVREACRDIRLQICEAVVYRSPEVGALEPDDLARFYNIFQLCNELLEKTRDNHPRKSMQVELCSDAVAAIPAADIAAVAIVADPLNPLFALCFWNFMLKQYIEHRSVETWGDRLGLTGEYSQADKCWAANFLLRALSPPKKGAAQLPSVQAIAYLAENIDKDPRLGSLFQGSLWSGTVLRICKNIKKWADGWQRCLNDLYPGTDLSLSSCSDIDYQKIIEHMKYLQDYDVPDRRLDAPNGKRFESIIELINKILKEKGKRLHKQKLCADAAAENMAGRQFYHP